MRLEPAAYGHGLQADGGESGTGSVFVAGYEFACEAGSHCWAERYTAEGALDPSFSGDGRSRSARSGRRVLRGQRPDGAGRREGRDRRRRRRHDLIRLTPSGALDPAFSGDGIANGLRWSAGELLRTGWRAPSARMAGCSSNGPRARCGSAPTVRSTGASSATCSVPRTAGRMRTGESWSRSRSRTRIARGSRALTRTERWTRCSEPASSRSAKAS